MKEFLILIHAMCKAILISLYLFFAIMLCFTIILCPIGIGMIECMEYFILDLRKVFPVGDYFEVPTEDEEKENDNS